MTRVPRLLASMGIALAALGVALVAARPASATPNCDVPNPPPICEPPDPSPTPTTHSPRLAIEVARQTTGQDGVYVKGWATDADALSTSLTIRISIDGGAAFTTRANLPRPDISSVPHGYEATLSASSAGHNVCVTAVSVGGGADTTFCVPTDNVAEFEAHAITYDVDHFILNGTTLEQLDKVTNVNGTTVQQSTTISGSKTVKDIEKWSNTLGVKVTASDTVEASIPLFVDNKLQITVEGSYSHTWGGSTETDTTYGWEQPVVVPAESIVVATVTVTHATITVAYTLTGDYVYNSGARIAGSMSGTYSGANSEDFQVTLVQTNLDGTPAAHPAVQQPATMLQFATVR